jgi:hypothetical protein
LLGMPRPKLLAIRNYRLRGVSFEHLMRGLIALGSMSRSSSAPRKKRRRQGSTWWPELGHSVALDTGRLSSPTPASTPVTEMLATPSRQVSICPTQHYRLALDASNVS